MYQAQIAVAENGNPQLTTTHPAMTFPVAMPARDFPTAQQAEGYAENLLCTAGVITPEQAQAHLVWISAGYTLVQGRRYAVRRAPVPGPEFIPA
jgi:hypothetical protein